MRRVRKVAHALEGKVPVVFELTGQYHLVVACRYNPDLKASYDRLIGAGKPPKLAITAAISKLPSFV
jgi:hypothetical protein